MKDLLRVEDLTVEFGVHEGVLRAVDKVSFSIPPGGTVAPPWMVSVWNRITSPGR